MQFDIVIEPILWFIAVGVFFILGVFFFKKYRESETEARAFFSGTAVFMFAYVIFRTIEVVRRYFIISDYYDIENWWYVTFNPISDISLYMRLAFLVVSWIGIAYFYFRIEGTILQRKTFYILTIGAVLKFFLNPMMYFPDVFPFSTIEIINTILFIIAGFFPVCLFAYFAIANYVDKGKVWGVLSLGMFTFILGEALSNPEAYMITSGLPAGLVAIGAPLMVILGGGLLFAALRRLYGD